MNRLRLRRRAVAAENLCDECRQDLPAIVELGPPERAARVCLCCLRDAVVLADRMTAPDNSKRAP